MCSPSGPRASKQMAVQQGRAARCEMQWEDEVEGRQGRGEGTLQHLDENKSRPIFSAGGGSIYDVP